MTASGSFLPMMSAYSLGRKNKDLLDNAPPGSTANIPVDGYKKKYFTSGSTVQLKFQNEEKGNLFLCFRIVTEVTGKLEPAELAREVTLHFCAFHHIPSLVRNT
jgi:hypothetical protein